MEAAVASADTAGDEFDLSEALDGLAASCVELLEIDTAGVLLADEQGQLHTVASSHEGTRLLELFQLCISRAVTRPADRTSEAHARHPPAPAAAAIGLGIPR
jgi:hypothetical protein